MVAKERLRLTPVKWLLIAVIFLAGVLSLVISEDIRKEYHLASLILHLFGAFLVIAIPIELLRECFFEEANLTSFVEQVDKLFDRKIDATLVNARNYGLDSIRDSMSFQVLFDGLRPGETLWWLDTFSPGQKQWIQNLEQALVRGTSVKMLVIDPVSPLCDMRAEEIGGYYKTPAFKAELEVFLMDMQACAVDCKSKTGAAGVLEVVTYNDLLGVPCYVVTHDDRPLYGYSSVYLGRPTGVAFPHFVWKQGPMCE